MRNDKISDYRTQKYYKWRYLGNKLSCKTIVEAGHDGISMIINTQATLIFQTDSQLLGFYVYMQVSIPIL